jgi:hypothetical protein
MGLFGSKKTKSTRAQRRAQAKALRSKARLEAKLTAKNHAKKTKRAQLHQAKAHADDLRYQLRTAKVVAKMQGKSDQARLQIAETEARAAVEGKLLSEVRLKRYLSTARLLAPVVVPLAYRAAQAGRNQLDQSRAARLGVPVADVAAFTGPGGALSARIDAARRSLDQLTTAHRDAETGAFAAALRQRLDDLAAAVTASDIMPTSRRRPAHAAISRELDGIEADVLDRLGVSS